MTFIGRQISLSQIQFTDTTLPRVNPVDGALPRQGALLLVDPTHPYAPWGEVPFTNNTKLVNVASESMGELNAAESRPNIVTGAGWANNGVVGLVNRTTKGGLHVMRPHVSPGVSGTRFDVITGPAFASYANSNLEHSYFLAFWGRITRRWLPTTANVATHCGDDSGLTKPSLFTRYGPGRTTNPATTLGSYSEGANFTEDPETFIYQDVAVAALTGTQSYWNVLNSGYTSAARQGSSHILYGMYLEDLTVSGRTYGQAHAAIYGKAVQDVLTPGGRYYGDTWTDPATAIP